MFDQFKIFPLNGLMLPKCNRYVMINTHTNHNFYLDDNIKNCYNRVDKTLKKLEEEGWNYAKF